MENIILRELTFNDKDCFIKAMNASSSFHSPWVTAPQTSDEFDAFYEASQQGNKKCFLIFDRSSDLVGVFNLNEIVRGVFQSAFLGYYGIAQHAGKGYMGAGLKHVLATAFDSMQLHRLEANIQPENTKSIDLVKANGFRLEGYSPRYLKINGQWRDHERWAMTLEDYLIGNIK